MYETKAASSGAPVRDDLMHMLSIMRDQGLAGVKQVMKQGGYLPAVTLALLAGEEARQQSGDRSAGQR